ncbi:MAG TPA: DJ-1/PfpI family protein, partial [Candidatus Binatus sp.]|nr:DJ-1/PfpI family protein [Candidatus Binatus sp.]
RIGQAAGVEIAILIFEGLTALDAVGPYEVLSRLPGVRVRFVATEPGPKRTENGALALVADHALADVRAPEIVVVSGGMGSRTALGDERILDWVRAAHAGSRWTTSVCTGSLILGAAGILRGLRATTHWRSLERLREFGAEPVSERVVEQGKVITAAGVSSGIDMALRLAELVAGRDVAQAIQLSMEYDPQPPFDAGSPAKAPPHVHDLLNRLSTRGATDSGRR